MILAVLLTMLSGVTIVISRTLNGELARATGPVASSLWNYVVGLVCSLVVLGVAVFIGGPPVMPAQPPPLWILSGGLMGMATVFLFNVTVKKISAFYLTLFAFIGQVFTGVALDAFLSGRFSLGNLLGGVAVTLGLAYNLYVDKQAERPTQ